MPAVSLEDAFQSFGFSPAEAGAMAAANRAHNGFSSYGYMPDEDADGNEEDEETDEVDLVETAENYISQGDFEQGHKLLLLCLMACMNDHGLSVVKLRVLVRLAELHSKRKEWESAVGRFEEAYKLWAGCRWLADADRTIHPVSFLPTWAECYECLGKQEEAAKTKEKATKFADQYSEYWDHLQ